MLKMRVVAVNVFYPLPPPPPPPPPPPATTLGEKTRIWATEVIFLVAADYLAVGHCAITKI